MYIWAVFLVGSPMYNWTYSIFRFPFVKYDAVGWAPKEYNPDNKQSVGGQGQSGGETAGQQEGLAPQSGFVWDEASGYYYDAASGFYYDANTGATSCYAHEILLEKYSSS